MKFDKYFPTDKLKDYVKYYVVSEMDEESEYKVLPSSGLVMGFQYKGQISSVNDSVVEKMASAGISGISDSYKVFKNCIHIGTILVYFSDIGFAHFSSRPANELFDLIVSLDDIFEKYKVSEVEEKLATVFTDRGRIKIVEQFLLSEFKDIKTQCVFSKSGLACDHRT